MGEQAERLQDLELEREMARELHLAKRSHDDQKCGLCRQPYQPKIRVRTKLTIPELMGRSENPDSGGSE